MHMMSILCFAADAVSSDTWFIVFKVPVLNDTMFKMLWHLNKFGLGSVVDFF